MNRHRTDREALRAAIIADPDSDTPRLVYADWLEEQATTPADEARAKFIRLEIEEEHHDAGSAIARKLESAAARLLNCHHENWNQELPGWSRWYESALGYRRGFPEVLTTVYRRFAMDGVEMLAAAPFRELNFQADHRHATVGIGWPGDERGVCDLCRIQVVRLNSAMSSLPPRWNKNNPPILVRLFEEPSFTNLQTLDLTGTMRSDDWVVNFVKLVMNNRSLRSIQTLELSTCDITDAGGMLMATSQAFDNVTTLNVTGNRIGPLVLKQLQNRFGAGLICTTQAL